MKVKISVILIVYFILSLFNTQTSSYAKIHSDNDNGENQRMERNNKMKREVPVSLFFNYYHDDYRRNISTVDEPKMCSTHISIIISNIIGYNETKINEDKLPEVNLIHIKEGLVLSSLYSNWLWDRQMLDNNFEVFYNPSVSEQWTNTKQIKV